MSKHPDPPLNPLALHIDQYSHEQADILVNGVSLAGNILKDSVSVRLLPDSNTVAVTLTFLVDDFQHKSPRRRDETQDVARLCGGAS